MPSPVYPYANITSGGAMMLNAYAVWMQIVLWSLFMLATAGCFVSAGIHLQSERTNLALQDATAWLVFLTVCVLLHVLIDHALAI